MTSDCHRSEVAKKCELDRKQFVAVRSVHGSWLRARFSQYNNNKHSNTIPQQQQQQQETQQHNTTAQHNTGVRVRNAQWEDEALAS
jgi:hypothetical protein